jgi:hypothetical protein
MSATGAYQHLEARPRSNYQQLWVKGRHIRAEVLYRHTVGPEPRSVQEVADDYGLPVAVVQEAVDIVFGIRVFWMQSVPGTSYGFANRGSRSLSPRPAVHHEGNKGG